MARALWKGAISFGLVHVPVELYPAEDRKAFQFSQLDKRDLSPVGYRHFNKKTGKEVAWADIVKGYEYEKGRYVVLSDEDFRRANVKATQTIDIQAFVPADEIPAEYFDAPYYLAPSGKGQKVYALLRETLRSTQRIAIAQVVIRTTQHLAALTVQGRALMLLTLRYADELREASGLELPAEGLKAAGITQKEVDLAVRLVDDMTEHWNPKAFKDTYHADLMARIREKIKKGETKEITAPAPAEGEPRTAQIVDLAELLKRSLGKGAKASPLPARRAGAPTQAKAALRLVHGSSRKAAGSTARSTARSASKPPARRKRA